MNLLVDVLGSGQVLVALDLSLDQMVAVDGGWHGDLGQARRDELQHGHLRRRVLHRNTVYTKKKKSDYNSSAKQLTVTIHCRHESNILRDSGDGGVEVE